MLYYDICQLSVDSLLYLSELVIVQAKIESALFSRQPFMHSWIIDKLIK